MLIPEKRRRLKSHLRSVECLARRNRRCADRSQAGATAFNTEHQMDSTLEDRFMEGQIASLEQQLSNLAREAGVSPSAPPTNTKTSRAALATIHRLADWRALAFVGSLLAASIGAAAGGGHPLLTRR